MKFLIDEMFGPAVAQELRDIGHEAEHLLEIGLGGAEDRAVLAYAVSRDQVIVTENAVDFVPLLDERAAANPPVCAVVIALKRSLPRDAGALAHHLAHRLSAWAGDHPSPYAHVHWLA